MKNLDKLIESTLYLFKSVPEVENSSGIDFFDTLIDGYLISKDAIAKCPEVLSKKNLALIKRFYGYDIRELNRGFYKSFSTPKNSTLEKLLIDQLTHYFTTYGLEQFGLRDESIVYIPPDVLKLPSKAKPTRITIIKSLSLDKIESRTRDLIESGVALSNDSVKYICHVIESLELEIDLDSIRNKEVRIRMYDFLGKVPALPEEFLRFLVYKKTGSTLLIKNRDLMKAIVVSDFSVAPYFARYKKFSNLAQIFYRFKPIWIAFKFESKFMSHIINRIRRLAKKFHKPSKPKILDTLTSNPNIDLDEIYRELEHVTIFKRISLANAILFRQKNPKSIAYFIRNGKAFAAEFKGKNFDHKKILELLLESIVEVVRKNVKGKSIHLPANLDYAAPTSEKLFWQNIPFGSNLKLKNKNIVAGVHWENVQKQRIDLDLHLISTKRSVGWNNWLSDDNFIDMKREEVIFSGDMTDAPKSKGGATEAFFIGESVTDETFMLSLNFFNFDDINVPFKFIVDDVKSDRVNRKYLIDSHTISFVLPNTISNREMFLGFIHADDSGQKNFLFTSAMSGNKIVSRRDENSKNFIQAIISSFESNLKLKDLLERAGARFEKTDDEEWDIDLDPQLMTKDTILNLFK